MKIQYRTIYLKKRFPLAISRGVHAGSDNLFLSLTMDGITGEGEMSPGKTEGADTPAAAQASLTEFLQDISEKDIASHQPEHIYEEAMRRDVPACALAALDIALWDWHAKRAGKPLYELLEAGLPVEPTSVTIGINPPEVVRARIPLLLDGTGVRSLKIKLGSPEGIDADKAMYEQVLESTKPWDVKLRVDANGGWSVKDAGHMMDWIAARNADYIEQPLKQGAEQHLKTLFKNRALPIFIDESCRFEEDVERWADCIDGVNMKLMKCGGITEARRIIATAKHNKLKTMIGCMGESSMSISAAAALTGLLDHVDLDSQLNLDPDPCTGAVLIDGVLTPNSLPGHGAALKPEFVDPST